MCTQAAAVERRLERLVGPSRMLNLIDDEFMTTLQKNLMSSYQDKLKENIYLRMGKQAARDRFLDTFGYKMSELDTRDEELTAKKNQTRRIQKIFPQYYKNDFKELSAEVETHPYIQPEELKLLEEKESKFQEAIDKVISERMSNYVRYKIPAIKYMDDLKSIEQLYEMADAIVWRREIPEEWIPGLSQPKRKCVSSEPHQFEFLVEKAMTESSSVTAKAPSIASSEVETSEELEEEETSIPEEDESSMARSKSDRTFQDEKEDKIVKAVTLKEQFEESAAEEKTSFDTLEKMLGEQPSVIIQSEQVVIEDEMERTAAVASAELPKEDTAELISSELKPLVSEVLVQESPKNGSFGSEITQAETIIISTREDKIMPVSPTQDEPTLFSLKQEEILPVSPKEDKDQIFDSKESDESQISPNKEQTGAIQAEESEKLEQGFAGKVELQPQTEYLPSAEQTDAQYVAEEQMKEDGLLILGEQEQSAEAVPIEKGMPGDNTEKEYEGNCKEQSVICEEEIVPFEKEGTIDFPEENAELEELLKNKESHSMLKVEQLDETGDEDWTNEEVGFSQPTPGIDEPDDEASTGRNIGVELEQIKSETE